MNKKDKSFFILVPTLHSLLREDSGWIIQKSAFSPVRFILSVDSGDKNKSIKEATVGFRVSFKLKKIKSLENEKYPNAVAAKALSNEIEDFLKNYFKDTFESLFYKFDYTPVSLDTLTTFPRGHLYDSSSGFKFDSAIVTDIFWPVTAVGEGKNANQWMDYLNKTVLPKLKSSPLLRNMPGNPWSV